MSRCLIICILLGITGCSNKVMYNNLRIMQRDQCIKEHPNTYNECIERANKPYEQYERERQETFK
jgi:hypothetical protein